MSTTPPSTNWTIDPKMRKFYNEAVTVVEKALERALFYITQQHEPFKVHAVNALIELDSFMLEEAGGYTNTGGPRMLDDMGNTVVQVILANSRSLVK